MKYEKTWRFKSIIKQSLQIQRLIKFKWVLLKLILFHYWWKNIIKNETENYININNISITLTTTKIATMLMMKLIIKVAIVIIHRAIKTTTTIIAI